MCISVKAYAEDCFSHKFSCGIKAKQVCELVNTKYSLLSKLVWETTAFTFCFEESISFSSFQFNLGVNTAIPNTCGTMTDSDYYMSGSLSQYSEHSNHLEYDWCFWCDAGYKLAFRNLVIVPMLSAEIQNRKFSAWNGCIQKNEEKYDIVGNGISYKQMIFMPLVKVNMNYMIKSRFNIQGSVRYSPFFYANCIDVHYFRNKVFFDELNGGFCIGGEIRLYFQHIGFIISYDYMKSGSNANTKSRNTGVDSAESIMLTNYTPAIELSSFYIGIELCL
ncbi:MAG: omptin family outer membrane protease [Treponema sp.]|uniref:omptin family outer membrane protease n=1 Tax=Treponema sp. TaxID=166 RepID=UPI0025E51CED|nr:omptin family outer membrane protease [Treponema sp.]MBQ8681136.1 omptin family outer membrane protease [Treponema sp.]